MNRSFSAAPKDALGHERAVLCGRMARLLHHALTGLDWPGLRFADRSRLDRALAQLESDMTLARTVASNHRRQEGGKVDRAGPTKTSKEETSTTKAASPGEA